MKNKNIRNWSILVTFILVTIILTTMICSRQNEKHELKTVKSDKKLEQLYASEEISDTRKAFIRVIGMPFSLFYNFNPYQYANGSMGELSVDNIGGEATNIANSLKPITTQNSSGSSKDYSTTNIQVKNVDEADITKTDGDYIYSISEDNIVITDVRNPKEIKIASKVPSKGDIPEDLILYHN